MVRMLPAGPGDPVRSPRADSLLVKRLMGFTSERLSGIHSDKMTIVLQAVTHEMIRTKKVQLFKDKRSGGFNCCNPKNDSTLSNLIRANKYCLPIPVNKDDSCYGNQAAPLNYMKSSKVLNNCKLDLNPTALNWETSFLDCKLLYNPISLKHMAENGGKVRTDDFDVLKSILLGYDPRSGQFSSLFLYLSNYYRLHNFVADELAKSRSSLKAPEFLLEVRKIVCAVYQKLIIELVASILREFVLKCNMS